MLELSCRKSGFLNYEKALLKDIFRLYPEEELRYFCP